MKTLATLYLTAWNWLTDYVKEILNAYIQGPIKIGGTGWLDFFYLGYTDLNEYLTFIFSMLVFIIVHYALYRFFKWLIKFFGGVVYKW